MTIGGMEVDKLYRSVQIGPNGTITEPPNVPPTLAALHPRDRDPESADGGGCVEHSRSGARVPRLYGEHGLAQPRGISGRARPSGGIPHAQMGARAGLP